MGADIGHHFVIIVDNLSFGKMVFWTIIYYFFSFFFVEGRSVVGSPMIEWNGDVFDGRFVCL